MGAGRDDGGTGEERAGRFGMEARGKAGKDERKDFSRNMEKGVDGK